MCRPEVKSKATRSNPKTTMQPEKVFQKTLKNYFTRSPRKEQVPGSLHQPRQPNKKKPIKPDLSSWQQRREGCFEQKAIKDLASIWRKECESKITPISQVQITEKDKDTMRNTLQRNNEFGQQYNIHQDQQKEQGEPQGTVKEHVWSRESSLQR